MITPAFLAVAAFTNPLSIDLDGDKKPEKIESTADGVKVGALTIPCEGECFLEAHDISGADKQREVAVCEEGPRDDKSCELWTLRAGKLVRLAFPGDLKPETIITAGNDVVLTQDWPERMYQRKMKYTLKGDTFVHVRQPFYAANMEKIRTDRSFAILYAPDSKEVVGTARPDSDVFLVGEHGEKPRWYLVKLSSGITGWVSFEVIVGSSNHLQMVMGAG